MSEKIIWARALPDPRKDPCNFMFLEKPDRLPEFMKRIKQNKIDLRRPCLFQRNAENFC